MLKFVRGDIFESGCEALVCPVNTRGVMGAGLALEFKKRFPRYFESYKQYCWNYYQTYGHDPRGGSLWSYEYYRQDSPKIIISAATKEDWRNPIDIQWVSDCLNGIMRMTWARDIESFAIPPLGCGLGGLNWQEVKPLFEEYFGNVPADIYVYEGK